jgi:hypothetical protein
MRRGIGTGVGIGVVCVMAAVAGCKKNDYNMYALTTSDHLIGFNASKPTDITSDVAVTEPTDGSTLVQIFYRPSDQALYGLSDDLVLYTVDPGSGALTAVSGGSVISGTSYASDTISSPVASVDPVADQLRVIATDANNNLTTNTPDNLNLRVDLTSGALIADSLTTPLVDQPLKFDGGDTNSGTNLSLLSLAYTNPVAGAGSTTLYALDQNTDSLVRIGNDGDSTTLSVDNGTVFTVGTLGVSFSYGALAIEAKNGDAYAALGTTLYSIDLGSGTATKVDQIGDGTWTARSLAVQPGT